MKSGHFTKSNGLQKDSFVMTEKLLTVYSRELGKRVGTLTRKQMHAVSLALSQVLGIRKEDFDE
ncbi:MAG: type II toxin-antitoxin system PemK/MazF family toxin [Clostridiales Family XIII bacterium]|nr:type II toxin-antitoxin system PemK/MazF family toxin [Clostridiales Family XIII bacterium]